MSATTTSATAKREADQIEQEAADLAAKHEAAQRRLAELQADRERRRPRTCRSSGRHASAGARAAG